MGGIRYEQDCVMAKKTVVSGNIKNHKLSRIIKQSLGLVLSSLISLLRKQSRPPDVLLHSFSGLSLATTI